MSTSALESLIRCLGRALFAALRLAPLPTAAAAGIIGTQCLAQPAQPNRHVIHNVYSVVVPPGVTVRPYIGADVLMAAFISETFELQIAYGGGGAVTGPKDVRLKRAELVVGGRPAFLEIWPPAVPSRAGRPVELRAHIEGSKGTRLDAISWCKTEQHCAKPEAMVRSIAFLSK